jgi:hypothetical protein
LKCKSVVADDAAAAAKLRSFVVHQRKEMREKKRKGQTTITPNELHLCTVTTHDSHPRLEFLVRYSTFPGIVSTSGQTQVRFAETVSSDPFLNVMHCLDFSFVFSAPVPA